LGLAQRSTSVAELKQQVFARHRRRVRKGAPKASTIAVYAGVFALIISIVATSYQAPQESPQAAVLSTSETSSLFYNYDPYQVSVDDVVATNIASGLAEATNLAVSKNVANLSVSLAIQSELAQIGENTISKPTIIQINSSRAAISYTAQAGDTVDSIAARYNVSKDTIKWANNLVSDTIEAGRVVIVLPINGVLYTVKEGDSIDSIAEKYRVDKERLIAYNDLEIEGIKLGISLILPDGTLPENERPGYTAPRPTYQYSYNYTLYYGNTGSISYIRTGVTNYSIVNNSYSSGWCTWWVASRRLETGRPVGNWGNANTWPAGAIANGYVVNNEPSVGAIIQYNNHVMFVEGMGSDGSVNFSEMNGPSGRFAVDYGTIPAAYARSFLYIH